ncbi:recombinase family protein [Burkholderia pseudomallei]|uniref:recombinase family protein n=1 Tax=Burkholderia pseudomallei TaxID=28450 RepID=UPI004064BACB
MKIGYARVSTGEQNLVLQEDALRRAGCDVIYTNHGISGASFYRPGLDRAFSQLNAGSTLVVLGPSNAERKPRFESMAFAHSEARRRTSIRRYTHCAVILSGACEARVRCYALHCKGL